MPQAASKPDTTKLTAIEGGKTLETFRPWKDGKEFIEAGWQQMASEVPFKLLPDNVLEAKEHKTVTGLKLPKCYGIPTGLGMSADAYLEVQQGKDYQSGSASVSAYIAVCVTMMLRYYHNLDWSFGQTCDLGEKGINDLFEFFQNERRGWKEAEPNEEVEEGGK